MLGGGGSAVFGVLHSFSIEAGRRAVRPAPPPNRRVRRHTVHGGPSMLLWSIIEAPLRGWRSSLELGIGIGALLVLGLGLFAAWERHSWHPMPILEALGNRRFSIAMAAFALAAIALMGHFSCSRSTCSSHSVTRHWPPGHHFVEVRPNGGRPVGQ
jgi:hypothetical protein